MSGKEDMRYKTYSLSYSRKPSRKSRGCSLSPGVSVMYGLGKRPIPTAGRQNERPPKWRCATSASDMIWKQEFLRIARDDHSLLPSIIVAAYAYGLSLSFHFNSGVDVCNCDLHATKVPRLV
jgi:hypothetical protein